MEIKIEKNTLEKTTIGLLKVAPLDAAEVLGYGKRGSVFPYSHLSKIRDLENRGIFDPDTCVDRYRAQVNDIGPRLSEIVAFDESDGKPTLRECPTSLLQKCFAEKGDFMMFYLGKKDGKNVIHAELIGPSWVGNYMNWERLQNVF